MHIRFISWLTTALAAGFLVVATAAFSLPTIAALALAISIGTLVVSIGVGYRYRNDNPTAMTAALTAVVSGWTIVASRLFSLPTVQNLAFAGALAIAGLAIVGLIAHEFTSEPVARSVEVEVEGTEHERQLAAA